MTRKRLYSLIIVLLLLQSVPVKGQTSTSFKLFFEKVYLHTDRDYYTAGEDIWLKAYLVNAQTGLLSTSSNNLYLELINPSSKISERKLIRLDDGTGIADFKLGDSIAAGTYRLRAYTSWMRNFGDNFIFEKKVVVVGTRNFSSLPQQPPQTKPTIQFFPEGGSAIEGVACIIAFRTEGVDDHLPLPFVKGNVRALAGVVGADDHLPLQPIIDFEGNSSGMGTFMMTPLPGIIYEANGTLANGETFKTRLPAALAKGFSMFVRNGDTTIQLSISTNQVTLDEQQGKPVMILGKSHGKTCYATSVVLAGLQNSIIIPKSKFPEGIAAITVFDASGRPQGERLVYIENSHKATLTVSTSKSSYRPKDSVSIALQLVDEQNKPIKTTLSMAVVDAGVAPDDQWDIQSYLMLQSEIKGRIENPEQYFDAKNPLRKRQLDLLLLTQGWRDFLWKRLADSALKITYPLEQGITVSGKVRQQFSEKPYKGLNVTLTAFRAKGNKLFSATTDSAGKFYLDGVMIFGKQPLKIASTEKGEKKGWIVLNPLYSDEWPGISSLQQGYITDTTLLKFEKAAAERITLINKQSIQMKEVTLKAVKPFQIWRMQVRPTKLPAEVFNITPEEKKSYKNLKQYLLANVQYNSVIFSDNPVVSYISMLGGAGMKSVSGPRVFVNGSELPFRDNDSPEIVSAFLDVYYFMALSKFQKIEIKRVSGFDSDLLETRDIYLLYLTLDITAVENGMVGSLEANADGYYEARSFFEPKEDDYPGKPDLRTTIYWNPSVTTNEKGEATVKFTNADLKTKMRVVVQGIGTNGELVSGKSFYEIK